MARNDLYSLRLVVSRAIRASGRRLRDLEDEIGVRHGNLRRLMEGEAEIRISHLIALARALGVPPADFLAAGCPKANRAAKHRLRQWIGADVPDAAEDEPSPAPFPTTAAALESVVQAAVERALAGWSAEGGAASRRPAPVVRVPAAATTESPSRRSLAVPELHVPVPERSVPSPKSTIRSPFGPLRPPCRPRASPF